MGTSICLMGPLQHVDIQMCLKSYDTIHLTVLKLKMFPYSGYDQKLYSTHVFR